MTAPRPDAFTQLPANMRDRITIEPSPAAGLDGCWGWTGALSSKGYGSVRYDGRVWSTHRLAYELLIGPIPDNLTIDHLCCNKRCANPTHMEPVTRRENVLRAQPDRLRCAQGHPLAGPNLALRTRRGTDERVCRVCRNDWSQANYQRRHPDSSRRPRFNRAQVLVEAERRAAEILRPSGAMNGPGTGGDPAGARMPRRGGAR